MADVELPAPFEGGREYALDLLTRAYAEGILDVRQLESRSERALTALTVAELEEAVASIALTADERRAILDEEIAAWTAERWEVAFLGDTSAALVLRKPPDHAFHAVLSLLTAGVWLLVWLGAALSATDERLHIEIDEFGGVFTRHVK